MDFLKELSNMLDIPEEELEKHITSGLMLAGVAGAMLLGKKGKKEIEKRINAFLSDKNFKESAKTLQAMAKIIIEKHRYLESTSNDVARPDVKIKTQTNLAPEPPKPPKFNRRKSEGEEKDNG